jgi:hypothetical protein
MEEVFVWMIPLTAIVGGIVYMIVKTKEMARIRELEIRERLAMIERGLVPPPEKDPRGFEEAMHVVDRARHRAPERHRSAGITLMGVGFGLMFMIGMAGGEALRGIGIGGFLVLLGLAFFINSQLERRDRHRQQDVGAPGLTPPSPRPPSRPPADSVSG